MNPKFIKPIPKYILKKIKQVDNRHNSSTVRMYSYLTTVQKDLVKITVAVKKHKGKWYCKQVAAHGVKDKRCRVKNMEYMSFGYGYRVGWYAEGLTKHEKWYEDGNWCEADFKYYNPGTTTVNPEYISRFPEYKYSGYEYFDGWCIISYLKTYLQFPQAEYLVKLGLSKLAFSRTILKRIAKDKKFCKWLIAHRIEISSGYYYIGTIMQAYKTGKQLKQIQALEEFKKKLSHDSSLSPIRELFKKDLERFFSYLDEQQTNSASYLDYLRACNYLGLDMTLPKNRFPHDFKYWHDLRIDEYHSAKAQADEQDRTELYKKFAAIAEKYMALQDCKKDGYAVFIARSPAELLHEGEMLNHCVGRMGYDFKMVREETLIFFVRAVDSPDIPFVTVEYSLSRKKVLQCYGNNDSKPPEEVIRYVNKVWLPFVNRTIKKMALSA